MMQKCFLCIYAMALIKRRTKVSPFGLYACLFVLTEEKENGIVFGSQSEISRNGVDLM